MRSQSDSSIRNRDLESRTANARLWVIGLMLLAVSLAVASANIYGIWSKEASSSWIFHTLQLVFVVLVLLVAGLAGSIFYTLTGKQRKTVETILAEEARTVAILDSIADGIITMSEEGVVTSFNAAASELFGYRADEVVGQNVGLVVPVLNQKGYDNQQRGLNRARCAC